jgi:hypothetical protein
VTLILTATPNASCGIGTTATDTRVLTIHANPTNVFAGAPHTICEGDSYPIGDATATNTSSVLWSSPTGGTFDNGTTLAPTYHPTPADIANGSVVLTLTANAILPCNTPVTRTQTLTIQKKPVIIAGPDDFICQGSTFTTAGASVLYGGATTWSTSGTGSFTNASQLTTVYNPSAFDVASGGVTLTLTAASIAPCGLPNPFVTRHLTIVPTASANAGANANVCANGSHTIIGASATNYISLNWVTSGTGVISGNGTLTPTYTPSAADALLGSVTLTLHATPAAPCPTDAISSMVLTIDPIATIVVGAPASVCEDGTYSVPVGHVTASNYTTINWTTSGTGTFTLGGNSLTPTYDPSSGDAALGFVNLTATVTSALTCSATTVSDILVLTVTKLPIPNAGLAGSTCGTNGYQITGATAPNAVSVLWTSTGTGLFSNNTNLNPIYTPSAADVVAGSVTVT